MPQEVPVATQETAPELKPQETPPEAQTDELKPQEQQAALAEAPAQPTEKPPEQTQPTRPQVQAVQKAPERKRIAAPTDKNAAQKKQRTAAVASDAASGIGRGRSDRYVNYPGIVRAHLVRYKQYSGRSAPPATGRRDGLVLDRRQRPRDVGAAGGQFRDRGLRPGGRGDGAPGLAVPGTAGWQSREFHGFRAVRSCDNDSCSLNSAAASRPPAASSSQTEEFPCSSP